MTVRKAQPQQPEPEVNSSTRVTNGRWDAADVEVPPSPIPDCFCGGASAHDGTVTCLRIYLELELLTSGRQTPIRSALLPNLPAA